MSSSFKKASPRPPTQTSPGDPDYAIRNDLFGRVGHLGGALVASGLSVLGEKLLVVLSLLILLDKTAAAAAAGEEDISDAVTLEVVLLTDVLALHGQGDEAKTEAVDTTEEKALNDKC